MSEYNITNLTEQLVSVYKNSLVLLQGSFFNFSNYIWFGVFVVIRIVMLLLSGGESSFFEIFLSLLQSVYLLASLSIILTLYSYYNANKINSGGPLGIILAVHLLLAYLINLYLTPAYYYD